MKKGWLRRASNRILHLVAQFGPGATSVRPFIHKLRGVKIYGDVFIGDEVYIENEYPENVEIHDQAQIVIRSVIVTHFRGEGKVIVGPKVWIGAGCIIAASAGQTLTLGEGAVIAAGAVVTKDVAPFTMVGGIPAKAIRKVTVPMTLNTKLEDFKNGLRPLDEA